MRKIISVMIISTSLLFSVSSSAVPGKFSREQQRWWPGCCQFYDCPMRGDWPGGFLSKLPYPDRQEYHQLISADHFDKSKFEAFFDKHGIQNKDEMLEWSYQRYEIFHQLP